MRFFSDRDRPVYLGPYPMERLKRAKRFDLSAVPAMPEIGFARPEAPASIVNAMGEYQAMMDAIRDGLVNRVESEIPRLPEKRAEHFKAFGYFSDASMVGIGPLPASALLAVPRRNPDIDRLADDLRTRQTKTLASGIDTIMADLKDSMAAPPSTIDDHAHAIVFMYEMPRDPRPDEPGAAWLADAQMHRACLRATETAVVVANYIRLLGWDAKAHSLTSTDVDLNQLAVTAGLARVADGTLANPFLGTRFGLAAVSTRMELTHDAPLAARNGFGAKGLAWWIGQGHAKSGLNRDPFKRRDFALGPHKFESLKRRDTPTTYIDEARVARVPKRTDMFARAQFGDMGKRVQDGAKGGYYARKAAPSSAQRRMLGAFVLLQDGTPAPGPRPTDPAQNALNLKAASYFLGVDAVGLSRCPDWAWYSHDATGAPIVPTQENAISMIIDQGFETMEGASGDDWISVAQSMRAYLRFSLLGGVIAQQIRNLGYTAKAHSVMDGEVLQPPLLLLSGLGEVSRIGEVILNPFLGPRLKSGVVTTDMPMTHDRPIDFGLQNFCNSCNKCARECPAGAITAGPKLMFNGYEIWKSDSQKCATYRITTEGGAMCGRCMKTCPWNLEGLFAEAPYRWAAMNLPSAAKYLAELDDKKGKGSLNPVKKWWWDLALEEDGGYRPTRKPVNARTLQPELKVDYAAQTLAVYPASLAPHPWPYPYPMDREKGIKAYQEMIPAETYKALRAAGETGPWDHQPQTHADSPVLHLQITAAEAMTPEITKFTFQSLDGGDLPEWQAGAHLDVVVAPEYLRQYSMSGDPADRSRYEIGVLREAGGRGGSALLHRIFTEGRRVFVSRPINHFPLAPEARRHLLMGGGIGITPMIAMAHALYRQGADFELHYSIKSRASAAYLDTLATAPWRAQAQLHISDEDSRADLPRLLRYSADAHVYTCGPEGYMAAVIEAATQAGFPESARHLEYFAAPEPPPRKDLPFRISLAKSGYTFEVFADQTATAVLEAHGYFIDVKCNDGICGVCKCGYVSGDVDHRDYVLSSEERKSQIILCKSRAATAGGTIELDL